MYKYFVLFLFLGIGLFAQEVVISDSVTLSEVVVSSSRSTLYNDGSKRITVDSIALASSKTTNLSELLSQKTLLSITNYGGSYSASSISLRSAGNNRTLVTWGGFPLNSSTLGTTDISFVPSAGFNSVTVNYGASGTFYGSGAIGGAVDLDYVPSFDTLNSYQISESYGSFNT
jgi:vitamin B12 transporter